MNVFPALEPRINPPLRGRGGNGRASRREERREKTIHYYRALREDPCSYCGGKGGTVDHIIPQSLGGIDGRENMTGACENCNTRKDSIDLLGFLLKE